MTDKVKARLIELLPGIHKNWKDSFYIPVRNGAGKDAYGEAEDYVDENPDLTPITLADVLRAINEIMYSEIQVEYTINSVGYFESRDTRTGMISFDCAWNLLENFDNQTPETKAFIGSLIGVTE